MTALERLGSYLANGQAPPRLAFENAKLRVVDNVAAWIGGLDTTEGRALTALRTSLPARRSDIAAEYPRTAAAFAARSNRSE